MTYHSEFSAGCQMAPPSRWYPQGVFTVTWFRRTAAARVKKAAHVSFTICIHTFLNYIFFITLIMAVRSLNLLGGAVRGSEGHPADDDDLASEKGHLLAKRALFPQVPPR